jgi:hypothetical protein
MRRFLYILTTCLLYLLLSSESCNSRQDSAASQEAELTKDVAVLKSEFESDELSEKSLHAFEIKAKQKLVDFSDYLNIYTVKLTDESFRTQARQMILDLFISENIRINCRLLNEPDRKDIPVNDFLNEKFGYDFLNLKFDSIRISQPLHLKNGLNYSGSLRFSRFLETRTSSDTLIKAPAKMEVEIFVSKIRKAFGRDTLQIWNVSLGNIY